MIAAVDAKQPGDEVELTLVRAGDQRTVTVELGDRPAQGTGLGTPQRRPLAGGPRRRRSSLPHGPANLWPMRVKFCGIARIEDAREAARLGAWAIGLNHSERSPRRCDPTTAVAIAAELRREVEIVGVFVNPTLDELARAAEDESLAILQLHGDEGPDFCREAARRTGCR